VPTVSVRCANCGAKVQRDLGYCPGCGTALGMRLCANGHVMDAKWSECRYCSAGPADEGAEARAETPPDLPQERPDADPSRTSVPFGSQAGLLTPPPDRPKSTDTREGSGLPQVGATDAQPVVSLRASTARHRTVYDPGLALEAPEPSRAAPARSSSPRAGEQRLVGWLVSFSLDPAGVDFRLREGRNVLGAGGDCDIVVEGDAGISEVHATLMYRRGELQIRDNDSTNGTYVNGEDIFGKGVRLETGDRIRLGQVDLTVHLL